MASNPTIVQFLTDQLAAAGVTSRKMFGEHALYRGGTLVALICDDNLFVKPTTRGRALAAGCALASPYPGAKPSLLMDPDKWDDREWLTRLIIATHEELCTPAGGSRAARRGQQSPSGDGR